MFNMFSNSMCNILHILSSLAYYSPFFSVNDDSQGYNQFQPLRSHQANVEICYEALQRKAAFSKKNIKDKSLAEPTKKSLEYALKRTYDKDEFVKILKEKGIDCVFRYTDEGRLYGATFIDHRTHCVLNGSRMGKAFSANALEQHFNTPKEEQIPHQEDTHSEQDQYHDSDTNTSERQQASADMPNSNIEYHYSASGSTTFLDALDVLNSDNPAVDPEEEAFRRKMLRKKKKRRGPRL